MRYLNKICQNSFLLEWIKLKSINKIDIFSTSKIFSLLIKVVHSISLFIANFKIKIILITLVLLTIILLILNFSFLLFIFFVLIISLYISCKRPIYAFMLMILSCGLSTKINLGIISSNLITIKIDDLIILSLLLASLWRYSQGKIKLKPLNTQLPFIIFICIGAISLLRGIFINTIDKPLISLLVMFKWIEYFAVFYLGYLYLDNRNSIKLIFLTFILTGLAVSLYGYWEYLNPEIPTTYLNYYRLFDRGIFLGQNNHVAGFFVLWLSLTFGLIIAAKKYKYKLLLGLCFILGILPFLATYSRKSYIALMIAITILILLSGKKTYLIPFLIILLMVSTIFGVKIFDRLTDIKNFFINPDEYKSQRFYFFRNWIISLKTLENYPFLGAGFGSRHRLFYESQWAMIIAETGLLGLLIFFNALLLIFKSGLLKYKTVDDWLIKGFTLGSFAGFLGIFIHSLTCTSMIVTRIGVPFWLLCGIMSQLDNSNLLLPYDRK